MPLETEYSVALMRRLGVFYVILAAIAVAVVIFVVDRGKNEKAQPADRRRLPVGRAELVHRTGAQARRRRAAAADRADAGAGARARPSTCCSPGSS